MVALYVEIDDYAAAWLRNLIQRDVIARGDVYCGDVRDVRPRDLAKYNQVHLYAGIGVWSYALRRAGIPDSANVWTFSEPCQPFSQAGKGLGFADERYLRPYTHHLVTQCRPAICLGEQVASSDGLAWLDVVQSDMEAARYAFGAIDTCSAGFGAPHIRQRLRFAAVRMADADERIGEQRRSIDGRGDQGSDAQSRAGSGGNGFVGCLADADGAGLERRGGMPQRGNERAFGAHGLVGQLGHANGGGSPQGLAVANGGAHELADSDGGHADATRLQRSGLDGFQPTDDLSVREGNCGIGHNSGSELDRPGPTNGFWHSCDWLYCRDGKWRPVEPGTFPLAHGMPRSIRTGGAGIQRLASLANLDSASLERAKAYRIGSLRAYGNAVDAEATTEFCRAVAHTLGI